MNLTKIHSITKKITVALLGGFLLIFILFHACANLCILRNDEGAWYSAFCHFMGTNYIVKVFEVILMLTIFCHICLTVWLAITNFKARGSVRYKHASRTKTHTGSKLMIWTGGLIVALLLVHFCDFYFVKLGWVDGKYMAKTEEVIPAIQQDERTNELAQCFRMQQEPVEYINEIRKSDPDYAKKLDEFLPVFTLMINPSIEQRMTSDRKWLKELNVEEKNALSTLKNVEVEPDFYNMAREKFHNLWICLAYLFCFAVVWFHLRHAVPSVFQTLGWNNYKYNKAIDVFGILFACLVCLMFAAVPIVVYFFL